MRIATVHPGRLFLWIFLAFGGIAALLMAVFTGDLALGGLAGTASGLAVAATMVPLHARHARLPDGRVADVQQARSFAFRGTLPEATEAAEVALFERLHTLPERYGGGQSVTIKGRTPFSWASWGEDLRVDLGPATDGIVHVHVESRPARRGTLLDCGKNLRNIEQIQDAMTRGGASARV